MRLKQLLRFKNACVMFLCAGRKTSEYRAGEDHECRADFKRSTIHSEEVE
jgi:hypothetical protein